MHKAALYEVKESCAWITLNRPDNRNALSAKLVNELYEHVRSANNDATVRVIVLTGNGPAFCAGANLKSPPGQSIDGGGLSIPLSDVLMAMWNSQKPIISMINGAAFGGGLGLVAASNIVITADDAPFSVSEVKLGVIPAVISVVCLPKLGTHHAMRLFLTGERFKGKQAVEYGLAHRSVSKEKLETAVLEEISALKLTGPNALIECKKLLRRIPQLNMEDGFKEASSLTVKMFKFEEAQEGIAAFREKRTPSWAK
ncbi:MAG: methylglutaconyl-CoA hydratase [Candidatus Azotimanducaceae bacterium]|jgi:methylglutaconyl-CoA hydratase